MDLKKIMIIMKIISMMIRIEEMLDNLQTQFYLMFKNQDQLSFFIITKYL